MTGTAAHAPASVPVTDHRPVPRGVLPRGVQTWLMAGLALVLVTLVLVTGQGDPPTSTTATTPAPPVPSPDRVRAYQERLRALEVPDVPGLGPAPVTPAPVVVVPDTRPGPPIDPLVADARRRDAESLFASNVAVSRRPAAARPDPPPVAAPSDPDLPRLFDDVATPSLDALAEAVVRATARAGGPAPLAALTAPISAPPPVATPLEVPPPVAAEPRASEAAATAATRPSDPLHRLLEGTLIDTVLTTRLDGTGASPVVCLVATPVYAHDGQHVLIPAGARVLGATTPVQAVGETRLAVAFHRLVFPDGRTVRLDRSLGLNQLGDAGLHDQVQTHIWATLGAAGAVGVLSGVAQWVGSAGLGRGDGDRTVIVAGGTDAAAQATGQVLSRSLTRLPTITIREGHRVKVYLTRDLDLPAYAPVPRLSRRTP